MKRKKWSELEELTLLSKYSDLLSSGTLAKLKTREKKFKPIAEQVNSLHHLQDPITFPFKWSWRDVSIKVQNMRHQYLGVKQKIRISESEFNWEDGEIHWENFLKYKEVFGDIELSDHFVGKDGSFSQKGKIGDEGISGILIYDDDDEEEEEEEVDEEEEDDENLGFSDGDDASEKLGIEEIGFDVGRKLSNGFKGKRLRRMGARVLELRDVILNREEKTREREWNRDVRSIENEMEKKEREFLRETPLNDREEGIYTKEMEIEEMRIMGVKREYEKRKRLEREFEEERRRRMRLEEKWEMEEMEWREKVMEMQMEHEKQIMQMHADSCQNQLQLIGVVARFFCQYFGPPTDGLAGSLGTPQVMQNLQHPGGLGDGSKPDGNSPSEFL